MHLLRMLAITSFVLLMQWRAGAIEQQHLEGKWTGTWLSAAMNFNVDATGKITSGSSLFANLTGQLTANGTKVTGTIAFDGLTVFELDLDATRPGTNNAAWRISGRERLIKISGNPITPPGAWNPGVDVSGGKGGTAPKLSTPDVLSAYQGLPYNYRPTATGDAPITISIAGALPPGLSMNSSNEIAGTPTTLGSFVVTVTASNEWGGDQKTMTINVDPAPAGVVPPAGAAVAIVSRLTASVNPAAPGQAVTFNVGATNSAGGALFYFWKFGDGSVQSGGASAVHAFPANGRFKVEVAVSNGQGSSVSSEMYLEISGVEVINLGEIRAVRGRVKAALPLPASLTGERRVRASMLSGAEGANLQVRGVNLRGKTREPGSYSITVQFSTASGQAQSVTYNFQVVY